MRDPEPPCEPAWVYAKMSRYEMELRAVGLSEYEIERRLRWRDEEMREAQFAEDC